MDDSSRDVEPTGVSLATDSQVPDGVVHMEEDSHLADVGTGSLLEGGERSKGGQSESGRSDQEDEDEDDVWFEASERLSSISSPPPLTSDEPSPQVIVEEVEPTAEVAVVGGVDDVIDSQDDDIFLIIENGEDAPMSKDDDSKLVTAVQNNGHIPPGLSDIPPILTCSNDVPPGLSNGTPGLSDIPVIFSNDGPPGLNDGPAGLNDAPPGLSDGPAGLNDAPPGLSDGPPGLSDGPPGLSFNVLHNIMDLMATRDDDGDPFDNFDYHDYSDPVKLDNPVCPVAASDTPESTAVVDIPTAVTAIEEFIMNELIDVSPTFDVREREVYLAESLVKELRGQEKMAAACKAEASYVEVCTAAVILSKGQLKAEGEDGEMESAEDGGMGIGPVTDTVHVHDQEDQSGMGIGLGNDLAHDKEEQSGMGIVLNTDTLHDREYQDGMGIGPDGSTELTLTEERTNIQVNDQTSGDVGSHKVKVHLANCLARELHSQQEMAAACKAETRYVEVCTAAMMAKEEERSLTTADSELEKMATTEKKEEVNQSGLDWTDGMEPGREDEAATDLISTEHVENEFVQFEPLERPDEVPASIPAQQDIPVSFTMVTATPTCDASINTDQPETCTQSTNTSIPEFGEEGVNTDPPPVTKETGCNTMLNCFDVLQRAKEMEELQLLKVEHRVAVVQMNEAKSQKMVAEELVKIVQSDLEELRQHNLTETTRRLQLENELSDVKVDLSQTAAQLKEKEERVQELEESLTGTSLLVRKLEEQNAVSLMSRGGIDYMLQAKLAEGRAHEAEQKLEVLQSELLQAQSEVRRLLERVAESSRDRSEMVSSKVHTQLMQIADEKAQAAERRNLEQERELQDLRGKLSIYEARGGPPSSSTHSTGLTGLTSFSDFSTFGSGYSSSGLSSAYSPFSYTSSTSKPLSLPDQYNLHSGGVSSLSTLTSAIPVSSSLSFAPTSTSGSYGNSNDTWSNSREEVGVAGILKPSTMFKKYGEKSHDLNSTDAPPTLSTSSKVDFELPSFEATPTPSKSFTMDTKEAEPGGHGNADNSDSSDWSSSSDDEGDREPGEEGGVALKPSHHTNLIAQWEWRTMADGTDTSSTHQSSPSPLSKRRAPPPVAPKPHGLSKMAAAGGGVERVVQFESSVSFDLPTHSASIHVLRKPRGPGGRSLPSRYHRQQLVT